ncbi:hypothetical protein AZL_a05120 (plasmid) [Azospirillum sp. B510]|uniref:type VI secretion system baseplate subunit TssK n=1 Tax=Azospirillum sp. (strain B510) TaxID=137722 RepID=UPI0001C4BCAF|nr:type VI secretion system baseplate subunit TssK [Azospirillum sp. B510]BAI74043.1 hypothetical protein AZL_a05120 [Azospirillum sp. B510]
MWTSKPIWLEAMFIRPQHFQQADRHTAWHIDSRVRAAAPHAWGWAALAIDRTLLRQGQFALTDGRGILPDGTPFDLSPAGALPPAREVPGDLAERLVHLALPAPQRGQSEVALDNRAGRYRATEVEVDDTASPNGVTAAIKVGAPAFRLVFEGESMDGLIGLGCARVERVRESREVVLSAQYIPPTLAVDVDRRLTEMLGEVVSLLQSRGNALAERLNPDNWQSNAGFLDFALLQTVNRHEPLLAGMAGADGLHPLDLHRALLELAGDLATFKTGRHRPPPFPRYRHQDLESSFTPLMAEIRSALTMVTDQPVVAIPLEARRFGIHIGQPADRTLFRDAQFVLAVNAAVPPDTIRNLFPSHVKVGPVEDIRSLVNLQLPGIGLTPLAVAPRQLPFHRGFTYFELDRNAASWPKLLSSAAIALHVSGDFPALEMEFWAIRNAAS